MDLKREFERSRATYEDARYNFIITEMDTALAADDINKRDHDLQLARQAYKTAMNKMEEHPLSSPMRQAVESRIGELHELLERFSP